MENTAISDNIAPLGKRICAGLIDGLLAAPVILIFDAIFGESYPEFLRDDRLSLGTFYLSIVKNNIGWFLILISLFTWMESRYGKTPGKFCCEITVVNESDGSPITSRQSAIRNLLRVIDGILFYLVGLVIILFDKNRQRLGDLVARTIVIED